MVGLVVGGRRSAVPGDDGKWNLETFQSAGSAAVLAFVWQMRSSCIVAQPDFNRPCIDETEMVCPERIDATSEIDHTPGPVRCGRFHVRERPGDVDESDARDVPAEDRKRPPVG